MFLFFCNNFFLYLISFTYIHLLQSTAIGSDDVIGMTSRLESEMNSDDRNLRITYHRACMLLKSEQKYY